MRWSCLLLSLSISCDRGPQTGNWVGVPEDSAGEVDQDGDGWLVGEDCDDTEPLDHPDADEHCSDGRDNDCDGDEDEADADCVDER